MDPEVINLVALLNQVPGIATFDSCFGHPERVIGNHQHHVFVGMRVTDQAAFDSFWDYFFSEYDGKTRLDDIKDEEGWPTWVQFDMVTHRKTKHLQSFIRLHIEPKHDSSTDLGHRQKLAGIRLLEDFIRGHLSR